MPDQPFLGQIMPVGFNFAPKGWHFCDGSILPISQNQALFSLLGTRYGGDGKSTFALPDLRGRAILGAANAGDMGAQTGTTTVTLTNAELPQHNHQFNASTTNGAGRNALPAGNLFAVNTAPGGETIFGMAGSAEVPLMGGTNVKPTGGGQPHNNMQPFLAINYVIALQGIYPSRN